MVMREVCDAWIDELKESVTELAGATTHRYAVWNLNAIHDTTPGLHLAVWPEADAQVGARIDTGGGDEITTRYVIQVWQRAPAEAERVFDDDASNGAWADLYETVQKRLYSGQNMAIGDVGSDVVFVDGGFDRDADVRVFALRFTKRRYQQALP